MAMLKKCQFFVITGKLRARIQQTCLRRKGGFGPTRFPWFQGMWTHGIGWIGLNRPGIVGGSHS